VTALAPNHHQTLAENSALREENLSLKERLQAVQRQLDWFRRQLFGSTSERLHEVDPAVQQSLLSSMEDLPAPPPEPEEESPSAQKPRRKTRQNAVNDTGLRFGDAVPVKVIEVAPDLP